MCKKLSCLILFTVLFGAAGVQAAEFAWDRAVFYDMRYPLGWAGDGTATKNALVAAGYKALNADELKTWMQGHIADKKYSVVVFSQDQAPDTVVETQDANCTLRKYLNAGGKIVWYSDIPFYYQAHANGTADTWADNGAVNVLGIGAVNLWDSGATVKITAAGARWGLTQTWSSVRPIASSTANIEVLATDNSGNAAAWVKHFVANDKFRGFVRFYDTSVNQASISVADIMRVAEYVGNKASNPRPANGAIGVTLPLIQWDGSSFAIWHDFYLGTSPDLGAADKKGRFMQLQTMYYSPVPLESGKTYYWRIDEIEADGAVRAGDVWSFTTAPTTAFSPVPRNGDKWIDPNADLTWQAGQGALSHDLYFGTDQAAVAARDAGVSKGAMYVTTFDVGTLAPGTTYYWVVNELDGTKYEGQVWSFTTNSPGGGVKAEYFRNMAVSGAPFLTLIEPDINHNWGDPGGPAPGVDNNFSARWTADLEIAIADTYTFIATSDDGTRLWLNDALLVDAWVDRGTTDSFSPAQALEPGIYSLRMEYYENTGGAVAQLSWQSPNFARVIIPAGPLQPPVRAKVIYPKDNDVNVPQDVTLMWSVGEKAVTHDVYFGTDEAAVAAATPADAAIYQGSQALDKNTFVPGALEWNKTYYWRVDEVNDAAADSPWKGSVWSFTTADFIVVDNFDSYVDDVEGRIFQTWIDGWGFTEPAPGNPGNGTSSTVGYTDPPFAENVIVHSGSQSMPFDYNNINTPFYSETDRTFATAQNWKVNGVTDLTLWVQGYPAKFIDDGTTITMSAAGTDIWNNADQFRFAYKRLNGDGSITAKVLSIVQTDVWAKAGVMIRESLTGGSANAATVVSAASGVSFQHRAFTDDVSANVGQAGLVAPYWVRLTRTGNTFKAEESVDGKTWTSVGADAAASSFDVVLASSIYIGLCVTSHNNNPRIATTGVFSDIKTTGGVSGQWQLADIGIVHPGNDPDTFYVALQDSAGKVAVVNNPDANATIATQWTQWKIPLSQFTGVNVGSIKKMYIGVGDRKAPVADGAGKLFIDDIRVVK